MSKMPNPFKLDPSVDDYGYAYYFKILAAAALLSVAGNVAAYAVDALPQEVVWAIHGLPPLIAVLMIHTFSTIRASFMGSIRRDPADRPASPWAGLRGRARLRSWSFADLALALVLVGLVGAVVAITLAVSFVSLAKVGEMAGWEDRAAWALPLMIDLPAFAATIGFIKADNRITEQERATAPQSADEAGRHQVADGTAAHPLVVADTVADRHPTAVADLVADWPVGPVAVEPPVAGPVGGGISTAVADMVADPPVADASPQVEPVADDPPLVVADRVADWSITPDPVADEPVAVDPPVVVDESADLPPVADSSLDELADSVADEPPAAGDLADLAERVHAATGTTKPVEAVVRVLELSQEPDVSQRSISTEVGVDRTLVSKWIKAADELVDERPSLAVVR